MTRSSAVRTSRLARLVNQWWQARRHELSHCFECGSPIAPFTTCCPCCGQGNPVKVSRSAVVVLVLGMVALAAVLSIAAYHLGSRPA